MAKKEKPVRIEKKVKPNREQEMQEKYIEVQILKQQISAYVEQKQALDEKQNEIGATIEALKTLPTVKSGEEMWSNLGSGTFVRSDIKDTEKVLVAIGAGVVSKEPLARAIDILESRLNEINEAIEQIIMQANAMVERINQLEPELEKF